MSIEEGLASTDVAKITAARGAAKGQVTKNIRSLKDKLVIENNKFQFDEIDENMVQGVYQKLDTAYNQFQDLHDKILSFRSKETDAKAEEDALQKENTSALKLIISSKKPHCSCAHILSKNVHSPKNRTVSCNFFPDFSWKPLLSCKCLVKKR